MSNEDKTSGGIGEFLADHARIIISVLIIILLIGTGIYAYTREGNSENNNSQSIPERIRSIVGGSEQDDEETQNDEKTSSTKDDEQIGPIKENSDSVDVKDLVVENQADSQEIAEGSVINGRIYSYKAETGDGVTHLARKAVSDYLKTNPNDKIDTARKIFIETRLKDIYYQASLQIDQEITFDANTISDVIDEAQNLSPTQVEAWNAYVHLVPSLK